MPAITITVRCASKDNFLASQGIPSYFAAVLECLKNQTFKNFELVYVDLYQASNADRFASYKTDFVVKHVDVLPSHRYWLNQNLAAMAASTNTAIVYADGELIVSLDDAEIFNPDLLERYWRYYSTRNRFMHAAHRRLKTINHQNGVPVLPISGDVHINDSRHEAARKRLAKIRVPGRVTPALQSTVLEHDFGNWLSAGKSFTLEDALKLNGFNERIDGNCCLEDCEFGVRLKLMGRKFIFDPDGCVFILDHPSYVNAGEDCLKLSRNFVAVETYGILRCAEELGELEANKHPITDKHLAIIERETLKYRKFSIFDPDNAQRLNTWKQVPTFDLRHEREELRRSAVWKW